MANERKEIKAEQGKITNSKNKEASSPDGISSDFLEVLEETVQKHDEAFRKLVDR